MFVVTGATGHTGSVVASTLLDQKQKVRVVVREAQKGEAWKRRGAEVAVADLTDEAALAKAFAGADGVYLLVAPNYASNQVLVDQKKVIDAYGLTESCSGDSFMEAGREIEKIGSVGRALAHVEIEIRDSAGALLPAGEAGEICLRGPKITQGYWRDENKTAASFHGDWFRTGDVGYLDAEGFLYLTDRVKDMIISGGENIASSEVERVVYQLPQVREAAIIGLPDEKWGERPVAVVALNAGHSLDYETLAKHCRAQLAASRCRRS